VTNEEEVLRQQGRALVWPGLGPAKFICTDDADRDVSSEGPLQTNQGTVDYVLDTFLARLKPQSGQVIRIADIMCGLGGFLKGAHEYFERSAATAHLIGYETNSTTRQAAAARFSRLPFGQSIELIPHSVTVDVAGGDAPFFDLVFFSPPQPNLLGKPDTLAGALLRKGMPRWKAMMSQMIEASYIVTQEMLAIELTDCYDRCGRYIDVSGEAILLAQIAGFALRGKTLNARKHSGLTYNDTSTLLFFTPD
jgi:hypothetical protein